VTDIPGEVLEAYNYDEQGKRRNKLIDGDCMSRRPEEEERE
jgi:hypothetical protein